MVVAGVGKMVEKWPVNNITLSLSTPHSALLLSCSVGWEMVFRVDNRFEITLVGAVMVSAQQKHSEPWCGDILACWSRG